LIDRRTLNKKGFIAARGRNNVASGNAPNQQAAAGTVHQI
jgi:hypothetical protein